MNDVDGGTLMTVCKNGDLAALKNTLADAQPDRMFDVNAAVIAAAIGGHLEVLRYLVEVGPTLGHNIDITAQNHFAMIQAAGNGHLDVLQYLIELERRQNPHIPDFMAYKHLAICVAVENGHVAVVKYLIGTFTDCAPPIKEHMQ